MAFDAARLDPEAVTIAAELSSADPQDLIAQVRSAIEEPRSPQSFDPADHAIRARLAASDIATDVLSLYYGLDGRSFDALGRYTFDVDGKEAVTAAVTRPGWNGLAIDLRNHKAERCTLNPDANISEFEFRLPLDAAVRLLVFTYHARLFNGTVFRLTKLDLQQHSLDAEFAAAAFMRCGIINGLLDFELRQSLLAAARQGALEDLPKLAEQLRARLPFRRALMPDVPSMDSFQSRLCAGGTLTLLAIARPEQRDFGIAIHHRSGQMADGAGLLSVIPRAFHSSVRRWPISENWSETQLPYEVRLSSTVLRELYEEVFGGTEGERDPSLEKPDWFFEEFEPLRWLRDHPQSYRLDCTCFSVALSTGGYGFGTLLAIHDEEFWVRYREQMHGLMDEVSEQGIWWVSSRDAPGISELLQRSDWTADGLQTCVEGLRRLAALYPERVTLPPVDVL